MTADQHRSADSSTKKSAGPDAKALVDGYDAALFDLDGVIYLGPAAVPGAAETVDRLHRRGTRVGFVTNNAARTPQAVATHLVELGIPAAAEDVVTSSQAAAHLLVRRFGQGARVLVTGGGGLWAAVDEVGLVGVRSAEEDPVAVIQGWAPELTWEQLNEAAIAINRGAHWVATNNDLTRPTNRGIVPGNGAAVAAVRLAVSVDPEVAGKPFRPLVEETVERLGAERPVFVGDRLDTDVEGAVAVGLDSLLVLTGAHGAAELLAAAPGSRPDHLGWDISALLEPPLRVTVDGDTCSVDGCAVAARAVNGRVVLDDEPGDRRDAVSALWAASRLAWRAADAGAPLDLASVLHQLGALR